MASLQDTAFMRALCQIDVGPPSRRQLRMIVAAISLPNLPRPLPPHGRHSMICHGQIETSVTSIAKYVQVYLCTYGDMGRLIAKSYLQVGGWTSNMPQGQGNPNRLSDALTLQQAPPSIVMYNVCHIIIIMDFLIPTTITMRTHLVR